MPRTSLFNSFKNIELAEPSKSEIDTFDIIGSSNELVDFQGQDR